MFVPRIPSPKMLAMQLHVSLLATESIDFDKRRHSIDAAMLHSDVFIYGWFQFATN